MGACFQPLSWASFRLSFSPLIGMPSSHLQAASANAASLAARDAGKGVERRLKELQAAAATAAAAESAMAQARRKG